jgi:hypothetical protein
MAQDKPQRPQPPKPNEKPQPLRERKDYGDKYPIRVTRPEPWPDPPPPPSEPSQQKGSRES